MAIAMTEQPPVRFVPESDRELPADKQTTFLLAPLNGAVKARVMDQLKALERASRGGVAVREVFTLADAQNTAILYGLKGWENFLDGAGQSVPFNTRDLAANINLLSYQIWSELWEEVMRLTNLKDSEKKAS